MDRLVTELKLQPLDAYYHLTRLLEQVNAVIGGFFAGERMEQDYKWRTEREMKESARQVRTEASLETLEESDDAYEEQDDDDLYFSPDRGNVIFASAIDGWAFRVNNFAHIFSSRVG